jgi:hypothetical protein
VAAWQRCRSGFWRIAVLCELKQAELSVRIATNALSSGTDHIEHVGGLVAETPAPETHPAPTNPDKPDPE